MGEDTHLRQAPSGAARHVTSISGVKTAQTYPTLSVGQGSESLVSPLLRSQEPAVKALLGPGSLLRLGAVFHTRGALLDSVPCG